MNKKFFELAGPTFVVQGSVGKDDAIYEHLLFNTPFLMHMFNKRITTYEQLMVELDLICILV